MYSDFVKSLEYKHKPANYRNPQYAANGKPTHNTYREITFGFRQSFPELQSKLQLIPVHRTPSLSSISEYEAYFCRSIVIFYKIKKGSLSYHPERGISITAIPTKQINPPIKSYISGVFLSIHQPHAIERTINTPPYAA